MAKIQLNYKSGLSMKINCKSFSVERNSRTGYLALEWEDASPRPLLIGTDEIESVWEL